MANRKLPKQRFERFLCRLGRQLEKLARRQLRQTQETVAAHVARWLCLDTIEAYGRLRQVWPHCPSRKFHRHGYTSGLRVSTHPRPC